MSILRPNEQTKYYFLSGFTAKLAGTERGITEPTPTFSACFGRHSSNCILPKYAEELVKRMKVGRKGLPGEHRLERNRQSASPSSDTRGIIDAILSALSFLHPPSRYRCSTSQIPTELPGVDPKILDPRDTYTNAEDWNVKATTLQAASSRTSTSTPTTLPARLSLLQVPSSNIGLGIPIKTGMLLWRHACFYIGKRGGMRYFI